MATAEQQRGVTPGDNRWRAAGNLLSDGVRQTERHSGYRYLCKEKVALRPPDQPAAPRAPNRSGAPEVAIDRLMQRQREIILALSADGYSYADSAQGKDLLQSGELGLACIEPNALCQPDERSDRWNE
ncbi:hypothetical protein M3632_12760 [Sphingopyxis alaskensis]|nr:hypothetical protein [Sphingopyxis alaskensis]